VELRDYLKVIRRRLWVIVAATAIVTIAALVYSLLQDNVYESEARVLITERDAGATIIGADGSQFSSSPERNLEIQVQLMQGRPLIEKTIETLGLDASPEQLAKRVQIAAVGRTNIVSVTVRSSDPQQAADVANTLADSYVTWSRDYKRESLRAAIDEVESRLEEARAEVIALSELIEREGETANLTSELTIATTSYTTLSSQLENLKVSEQLEVGSGRVVGPAMANAQPVAPTPMRDGILGLGVGLVFGLGMAFVYEQLDTTIRTAEDVAPLYGAPILGIIPAERAKAGEKRRLTIISSPDSPAAEAYRGLRHSLDFAHARDNVKTLLVGSAEPSEGKSTVAANLAASLAQSGKRVVLIDCDFRLPTTQQFFAVKNEVGLAEVLTGTHPLGEALQQHHAISNLKVITAGTAPQNTSELLGSSRMRRIVELTAADADWVILDSPPILAIADTSALVRWADSVLIVSKGGSSTREAANRARETLDNVGAKIIGTVVWGIEAPGYAGGYGLGGYSSYAKSGGRHARRGE